MITEHEKENLREALYEFFQSGATPLDVVGELQDAWDAACADKERAGKKEIQAICDGVRKG